MLSTLADRTIRHRRLVLVATVIFFVVAGTLGGGVASHLVAGGFDDPTSENVRADEILDEQFGQGRPNLVLLVTADEGGVDDPGIAAAGRDLTERLAAEPGVENVMSYWSMGSPPPLRSEDGTRALVAARITGDDTTVSERVGELSSAYGAPIDGATVGVSGYAEVFRQVSEQIEHDLIRAELIAFPVTLILLLFIFRGLVAALLPLAIGGLSIVGTFLVLRVLTEFVDVSIFALNLTTAMGLGLAIDYSLFIVSRYREELALGFAPPDAVHRTVRTAGKTIAFSALTVAASLAALLVFPLTFLRSFAYAGVAVAAVAGISAVVVLPALLAVLGHRVNALSVRRKDPKPVEQGMWHRVARGVMRRPWPIALGTVAVLLFLGSPFLGIRLGLPDDRVLPDTASSRQVLDVVRDEFVGEEASALPVVAPDLGPLADRPTAEADAAINAFAAELSALPGVARVDARTGVFLDGQHVPLDGDLTARFASETGTWLSVVPSVEPMSADGEQLVHDLRAADAPFPVLVGGTSAQLVDTNDALISKLPLAVAIIAVITFVLLFLMFGSVVVPIKALILNVLSLTATFGAMVWIFQEGNLSGVLNFTPTGTLDATTPILMFCVAFGLSMDYEVFLLSRIKEEHDRGLPNEEAVAHGLERTGRIVTAAALLISMVFLAIGTSSVTFIKLFGIGLTLAVLMDAFVIRGTLVPAFMRLAGETNWWAPAWLRRVHDRIGISEHVDLDDEAGEADGGGPDDGGSDDDGGPAPDLQDRPLVGTGP
jgi:RND superfamily putative drug exporter